MHTLCRLSAAGACCGGPWPAESELGYVLRPSTFLAPCCLVCVCVCVCVLPAQEPGGGDSQAEQMQRLKELMLNYSRFLFSIMLLHPEDLISQLRIVNCETLELSDTPEQVGSLLACVCVCQPVQGSCWCLARSTGMLQENIICRGEPT